MQAGENRRYTVEPRPESLGAGWRLQLFAGDEEMGGGVFPDDDYGDALDLGEEWLNGGSYEN